MDCLNIYENKIYKCIILIVKIEYFCTVKLMLNVDDLLQ